MKIKSLVSIIAGTKNARDRRLSIRKSWSTSEVEERRKAAISLQLRLESLITMGQEKSLWVEEVFELAACGSR